VRHVADQRVVAVLGVGVIPPDTPILRADDLGVLRGDGIFETMHVRAGVAWLLAEHLARMARSAARMQLELPPRDALEALVGEALAHWPVELEGALRVICTRGLESGKGGVTVFVTVSAVGDTFAAARHEGISVVTASLGLPADLRQKAPWLLGGAKTLSYAVNMASQRWAHAAGADDVLWVSTDGYALEAPTSTLVWLREGTLFTVPAERTGILAGTTARWLLDHADDLGWATGQEMVTPLALAGMDGAWLTSSVRGLAAIRQLDSAGLPTSPETTARIRTLLGYP
jgi:4-amino-4-deoxychorismate lyase